MCSCAATAAHVLLLQYHNTHAYPSYRPSNKKNVPADVSKQKRLQTKGLAAWFRAALLVVVLLEVSESVGAAAAAAAAAETRKNAPGLTGKLIEASLIVVGVVCCRDVCSRCMSPICAKEPRRRLPPPPPLPLFNLLTRSDSAGCDPSPDACSAVVMAVHGMQTASYLDVCATVRERVRGRACANYMCGMRL